MMSSSIQTTLPPLPAEIWCNILGYLPRKSLRACLFISSLWHDIALPRLFSIVHLYFGGWVRAVTDCGFMSSRWTTEGLHEGLAFQSWEVLNCICNNHLFAKSVKKVVVYAFDSSYEIFFERCCLIQALKALPHLNAFTWHASSHSDCFPYDITNALAKSCTQIRELALPRFPEYVAEDLHIFKRLNSVMFTGIDKTGLLGEPYGWSGDKGFEHLDEVLSEDVVIRKLDLVSISLDGASFRPFLNLTHLTIVNSWDLSGLHVVFQHATELESLNLCELQDHTVFPVLEAAASLLPRLTSFMIASNCPHTQNHFYKVSKFLQARSSMKRLCVLLFNRLGDVYILREDIQRMENLETLGIVVPRFGPGQYPLVASPVEMIDLVKSMIPPCVKTLLLDTGSGPELSPSIAFPLADYTSLTFLHVYNRDKWMFRLESAWQYQIAEHLPQLSIFGYYTNFSTVERSGGEIQFVPWSWLKTFTSNAEQFSGTDGEWLFRYNDYIITALEADM